MKKACMIKLLSVILLIATFVTALASCQKEPVSPKDTTPNSNGPADTAEVKADLPDMDWGDTVFHVLHWENPAWPERACKDIAVEDQTGDPINDAVYLRNSALKQKYNFTIELETMEQNALIDNLTKAINTNDYYYDLVYARLNDVPNTVMKGYFLDFETSFTKYVDLDKPYWDQDTRKDLSFSNKVYLMASSINISDEDATTALLFNKTIAEDSKINVSELYKTAADGKWTMDLLYEYMRQGKRDLNGDQVIDENDQYGFLGGHDVMMSFFFGGGGRMTEKDDNDLPVYTFATESNYNIVFKICDIMYDEAFLNHHLISNVADDYYRSLFADKKGLFYWSRMDDCTALRSVEDFDFGILPIPKYSESQENYISLVSQHTMGLMSVLNIVPDRDRVGFIMEAMAGASYYKLKEAYYDKALKGRGTRDFESQDMLDLIFAHRSFDVGEIFDFGGFAGAFLKFAATKDKNIASMYGKYETKINKSIESFQEQIEKLDNLEAEA